jgi:hypothetical protein
MLVINELGGSSSSNQARATGSDKYRFTMHYGTLKKVHRQTCAHFEPLRKRFQDY